MDRLLVGLPVVVPTHFMEHGEAMLDCGVPPFERRSERLSNRCAFVTCPGCLTTLGMMEQSAVVPPQIPMQFTLHSDGRVTVDRWDKVWVVGRELLTSISRHKDARYGERHVQVGVTIDYHGPLATLPGCFKGGSIELRLSNGYAQYELKRERIDVNGWEAELVEGHLTDPKKSKGGPGR